MEVRKCSLDAYNPGLFSSSFLLQTACHTLGITEAKKGNVSRFWELSFPASRFVEFSFRVSFRSTHFVELSFRASRAIPAREPSGMLQ